MILARLERDEGWLATAAAVAQRADCSRRQVGAVIVDLDDRIVSTGRNGLPAGRPGCLSGACPRGRQGYDLVAKDQGYDVPGPSSCDAVHAEANALLYAWRSVRGATMYVTDQPCPGCAKLIAGAGIERVVVANT